MDSGYSFTIVMRSLVETLSLEKDAVIEWHMQAGNITTYFKVKVDFTLPVLIVMNVVTCNFHLDYSAKGRYDIILGRDIIT